MITTVTLGSVTLTCNSIRKPNISMFADIPIPGREGGITQHLGFNTRVVSLRGILRGVDIDTDKVTLEGYQGTQKTYNDGIDSFTVYVQVVDIPTTGGRPVSYDFNITLRKI